METWLIIGGIVLLIGGIAWVAWYMEKKRTEAVQGLAESLGLEFVGQSDTVGLGEISSFPLFNNGHSRRVRNLVQGETEIAKIQIFDYQYTVGSGKHKSVYNQTVVTMISPMLTMPAFDLSPEGFFSRFNHWLGAKDIDFQEHPEFSNAFQLKGPDENAIRNFFHPNLMTFFCQDKNQCVSAAPGMLIFYRARKSVKPEQWKDLMGEGFAVYQQLTQAS